MQLADRLTLDAPRRTSDGYLAVRARAARTGVYDYLASEVDAPASFKPTDTVKVYRDAAEVFAEDAVRSFLGRPITNDHPRDGVTSANWRDHARGVVMGAMRDGEYLAFDLVLMDQAAIDAVERGKRELSNGYSCQLDWTPGTAPDGQAYDARQTRISGNHVALVDAGRAGPNCAIKDGERFALCDANPAAMAAITQEKQVKTITLDGLPVNLGDQAAVEAAIAKITDRADKAEKDLGDARAQVEKLTGEKAALQTQFDEAKAASDPAKLDLLAADRAALISLAKAAHPAVVTDGKSAAEIRQAVVVAKLGDKAPTSEAAIEGAFAVLTADAKPTEDGKVVNINPAASVANDSGAAVRDLARAAQY